MSLHRHPWLGVTVVLLASVTASACSTQARWVNCEGRLEPINQPAPKSQEVPPEGPQSPRKPGAAQ